MKNTIRFFFKGLRLFIDLLILIMIIAVIYIGFYMYDNYFDVVKNSYDKANVIVENAKADDFTYDESGTSYYDINNNVILMKYSGRYLEYDEIPSKAIDAVISIEDNRFFIHKGIDLKGIARAAYQIYKSEGNTVQGGSTITQQLLKLKYLTSERTYDRKLTEAFCALLFEMKFSKQDIMEYYMNTIYFANGYYGIDAASYGYFGTDATKLSVAQLAFILAIPNSPSKYDPYVNPDKTKERQERILSAMYNNEYLTEEEYNLYITEPISIVDKGSQSMFVDNTKEYPFSYIQRESIKALMLSKGFEFKYYFKSKKEESEYNSSYEIAYEQAKQELSKGYIIHTSISKDSQNKLQNTIDKFMNNVDTHKTKDDVYVYQAAATSIDNKTGLVNAIVGGRSDGGFYNRAYQAYRQPGSTIKPLLVYTPAIELKGYNANSIVNDHALKDGCTNANGRYIGKITLRTAVSNSINTIAWQLFNEIGVSNGLQYIKNMNFAKIVKDDYQLASGIGGLTNGVSTVEMASGYATLYNGGMYKRPTCITSIYNNNGECIYSDDAFNQQKQIYKKSSSEKMIDILKSVFDGTAKGLSVGGFCAGKTGTTNDYKDSWFCGITNDYSTAVWVGKDDGTSMGAGVTGAEYAGRIWHNYMKKINKR